MRLKKKICAFLLALAVLAPVNALSVGQDEVEATLRADGGAPAPPPLPPWPWLG